MLLTAVAYFMVALDGLVVVTALPSIHQTFGGGIASLRWTVNAYTLAFGAGILTAAALGDRFGRRRVYVAGLVLFATASAACGLAPSTQILIAFRSVQGIGAAMVMPLGLTILTSAFPSEKRGTVVGIWGGIAGLAVAAGPLVGGSITQAFGWHWIFWVNVPIGIAASIEAYRLLPESRGPRAGLDVPALMMVTAGIGSLILGLVQGGQEGWGNTKTLIPLLIGITMVVGFVWWEHRASQPMIPLGLFRRIQFRSAVVTQFCMTASIFSAAFLTSQFFQFARRDSPLGTGLRFLPWTAMPLMIAPIAGRLSDRIGARALIVPGLLLQAIGFGWIVHLAATSAPYSSFIIPFVLAGVGIATALPCVAAAGLNAVPAELLGKAAGTLNTMQQFGAVFGVAIVTAFFNAHGSLATPAAETHGYQAALTVSACASLLGALAATDIQRTRRHGNQPVEIGPKDEPAVELTSILR